eukprot:3465505-Rhodomonas_salina.2
MLTAPDVGRPGSGRECVGEPAVPGAARERDPRLMPRCRQPREAVPAQAGQSPGGAGALLWPRARAAIAHTRARWNTERVS